MQVDAQGDTFLIYSLFDFSCQSAFGPRVGRHSFFDFFYSLDGGLFVVENEQDHPSEVYDDDGMTTALVGLVFRFHGRGFLLEWRFGRTDGIYPPHLSLWSEEAAANMHC
jgi:hypothetical protein